MEIENLGYNASTAALMCRYDEEMGWYHLTVDSRVYGHYGIMTPLLKKNFQLYHQWWRRRI